MIEAMSRPRPPHLHHETTRHGKTVWFVRRGHGPRIRLRSPYGSPEFLHEYEAALSGERISEPRKPFAGTLRWMIDRYRDGAAWAGLSPATRRQREAIFRQLTATAGHAAFGRIGRREIQAGIERRKATPCQARHFLDAMRGLCRWAVDAGLMADDPTAGLMPPRRKRTTGFLAWTMADVAAFEERWPLGTRERVAFAVLYWTGLRRGDAVRLGRPHVRTEQHGGIAIDVIRMRTAKTGEVVVLAMAPELAAVLAAGPVGEMTFIAGAGGRPLVKESFGTWFRLACRAAGTRKSAHGLRKLRASIAAEQGATAAELDAMFGWRGGRMAAHYTRTADRERLGLSGAAKAFSRHSPAQPPGPDGEQPIPSPGREVRERTK